MTISYRDVEIISVILRLCYIVYFCLLIEWNNCELNEWECRSGQCIPMESRCDIKKDCFDGSDELNCGKYAE